MSDWRRPCAKADAPRLRTDVRGAFADRVPIDWTALLEHARDPRHRAALEDLAWLDRVRAPAGLESPRASLVPLLVLRGLIAIAVVQIVFGLAAAAGAREWPLAAMLPRILLAAAFGGASLLLGAAAPRDSRCLFLCATFAFVASAFARGVPAAAGIVWPAPLAMFFRGALPEAFAPAALWQFAGEFPFVRRFTAADTFVRRAAFAAWAIGALLFFVNLALAVHVLDTAVALKFARGDPGNLFWHLVAAASLPAVMTVFVRAPRATAPEQRKTARFASAVVAGFAPFLALALARMAFPPVDAWVQTAAGPKRLWLDALILGALASVPVRTTLAVVADRTFERDIAPVDATYMLLAPAGRRRSERRFPWRRKRRDRLGAAFERIARARGARELRVILRRELQFGVGARAVRILEPASFPRDTALLSMLEESAGLLDFSRDGPLFRLMPRHDREWLEAQTVSYAAAVRRRDDVLLAVVALGTRSDRSWFDTADRWFISMVMAAAAVAWEAFDAASVGTGGADEVAFECPACGLVGDRHPLPCACGADSTPAALPPYLSGKFEVVRRLGSGGMGVVYVARDLALDRIVALKTLPELRDGTASRLAAEARSMAALNHDALATIYGLEFWHRTPVLVMEYFPAGTLAETLSRGAMTAAAAVAMALRLAGALAYMHARGVLHRDIKPSNIGLAETGAAKLLDFGLAAERHASAGTRDYLPPEALHGESPGPAFDLWGLSRVLLECCERGPSRSPSLDAFLNRALSPDPHSRFLTAEEFRAALLRVAADLASPRDAPPPTPPTA